ncbi:hypothetical protein RI129_007633 [Pyrocoelia pectoralis]|uniref:Potassium channel domain-containing protein n=1 Tax=Pyrocoelia pectoralis TaxID=417401 RepID=A0AAN7VEG8_9COLE
MMNKKQWLVFLCVFVCYLLLGAFVFYFIESKEEGRRILEEDKKKQEINDLIREKYPLNYQEELFIKISDYCKKSLGEASFESSTTNLNWSYYHSVFFVLTILSTIGYGNLSPTTTFTRAFMIIYGIVGIPINGIVIITLGDYFGKTFTNIYQRWRSKGHVHSYETLGLIGKILLSSIPGFALLIIVPSFIIVLYEGWRFDRAVEFAFGTLTTIGTGQLVPDVMGSEMVNLLYKCCLLIWIIIGLGYLAMVFGFITKGLQSNKMIKLEQKLRKNIKKTNKKIRKELRFLLNDFMFAQSYISPVYRERRINVMTKRNRTLSCPDLMRTIDNEINAKRRALSVVHPLNSTPANVGKSDTDLHNIDKIKTFESNISKEHNQLMKKVVNALADLNFTIEEDSATITSCDTHDSFDSENKEITKSDAMFCSTTGDEPKLRNLEEDVNEPESLFSKLKKTLRRSFRVKNLQGDVEVQFDDFSVKDKSARSIDDKSLSDFLRQLSIINFNEISQKGRKNCDSEPSETKNRRRLPIVPPLHRTSLISTVSSTDTDKKNFENIKTVRRYSATSKCNMYDSLILSNREVAPNTSSVC